LILTLDYTWRAGKGQKNAAGTEESASAVTEPTSHAETLRTLVDETREMVGAA
jgi:hypothetical protein